MWIPILTAHYSFVPGAEDSFLFKLSPTAEVFSATGYNSHYAYFNMNQTSLPNGLVSVTIYVLV